MLLTFEEIKKKALSLGFDDAGVTTATISEENIENYLDWIKKSFHGEMKYMENDLRCYPDKLFPGAKSAIIFISYYKQEPAAFKKKSGLIASYARGKDYHNVHRSRLKKLIRWMEEKTNQKGIAKGFSDSSPVLEKALAVQAGLGWFGKNTLLIHRKFGTFTLISGILTTIEFAPQIKLRLPKCGSCQKCLDACPTQALQAPYLLDAKKCLSYHLIESKKQIPNHIAKKNPGYIFGCDICQDICPHNIRKASSQHEDFNPKKGIGTYLTEEKLQTLIKEPDKLFGTPLKRRGQKGLEHTFKTIVDKETAEPDPVLQSKV